MLLAEILFEFVKWFDLADKTPVWENPSATQVHALFAQTNTLRGIWYPGTDDFWIWHSYQAAHFQIAALIGIPLKQCGLLVLKKRGEQVSISVDSAHSDTCLQSPNVLKSLSNIDWQDGGIITKL